MYLFYYMELRAITHTPSPRSVPSCDILLLGASALHENWGSLTQQLLEALPSRTDRRVRLHYVAVPGQTSPDSFYKYRHLADQRFDLVLVYDGINDVAANNFPTTLFREDYSHWSWYERVNHFENRWRANFLVLPYTVRFLFIRLQESFGWPAYARLHRQRPEWRSQGSLIKTIEPFRSNLRAILEIAQRKREPVLLMTQAFYISEGYTAARFREQTLDHTTPALPIETWGQPENVRATLSAHNAVIAALARQYEHVIFVDQDRLIPKSQTYFRDICHLTAKGSQQFVENIRDQILALMRVQP